MRGSARTLTSAAVGTVLIGIGMTVLILGSDRTHASGVFASRGLYVLYLLLVGWGVGGTGVYAWARRPVNAIGPLLTAVGIAWLASLLEASSNSTLFAI